MTSKYTLEVGQGSLLEGTVQHHSSGVLLDQSVEVHTVVGSPSFWGSDRREGQQAEEPGCRVWMRWDTGACARVGVSSVDAPIHMRPGWGDPCVHAHWETARRPLEGFV